MKYVQCRYLGKCGFAYDGELFDVTLDEAKMRSIIEAKALDIDAQLLESSIVVGEDSITLLKGASGMTLDTDSVFNSFRDAFLSGGSTSFTYESAPNTDESFDFQSLYNDIYSEVAEAEIVYNPDIETTDPGKDDGKGEKPGGNARTHRDPRAGPTRRRPSASPEATPAAGSKTDPSQIDFHGEPFIVTQSSVGRTFDVAEAEKAWAAASYGDTVTIPMTVHEARAHHGGDQRHALPRRALQKLDARPALEPRLLQ